MLGDFLAGVRVLDVSQFLPGPFATQMLADMGADVLKVEPPAGDPQRRINPLTGQPGQQDKRGPFYDAVNAGKTVVKINLKSDAGKQAFEDLLRAADVLLESYRPGVLDRLGFGRDHLEALNPGLIHCALSGYGQTGPNRLRSGHDINYVASTGAMSASGIAQRPVIGWPPAADYASALQAALTVSGALLARTRTGKGAYLDVSLSESMLAWQALGMTGASSGGAKAPARAANLLNGGAACYQVYEASDGRFVTLGALEAHFWANFCQAVGRDDWRSRQHETLPQIALIGEVAALFATKPLEHWEQLLAGVDCCYYAVLDYAEASQDPHVVARGLMTTGGEHDGEAWTGVLYPAYVDGNPPQARTAVNEVDVETALSRWRD